MRDQVNGFELAQTNKWPVWVGIGKKETERRGESSCQLHSKYTREIHKWDQFHFSLAGGNICLCSVSPTRFVGAESLCEFALCGDGFRFRVFNSPLPNTPECIFSPFRVPFPVIRLLFPELPIPVADWLAGWLSRWDGAGTGSVSLSVCILYVPLFAELNPGAKTSKVCKQVNN